MQATLESHITFPSSSEEEKIDAIDLLTIIMSAERIHDNTPDRGWEAEMMILSSKLQWSSKKTIAVQARLHALCDVIAAEQIPDMTLPMLKDDLKRSMPLFHAAASVKLHNKGKGYYLNPKVLLSRAGLVGLYNYCQEACPSTRH